MLQFSCLESCCQNKVFLLFCMKSSSKYSGTSCTPCARGHSQSEKGSRNCIKCPRHFYQVRYMVQFTSTILLHIKWNPFITIKDTWYTWSQIWVKFVYTQHIKIWMILFWPRVHRWETWIQSSKVSPGGRVEIENVTFCRYNIFNFSSATWWHLSTLSTMDPW